MSLELARQVAAQAWCTDQTKHIVMVPKLAFAFADILELVWNKPWLGNATPAQLLGELHSRIGTSCDIDSKSVLRDQEDFVVNNDVETVTAEDAFDAAAFAWCAGILLGTKDRLQLIATDELGQRYIDRAVEVLDARRNSI